MHLSFCLPQEVGPSTTKFIIIFVHVSSYQYKWPDNQSLFHLSISSICWRSSLLSALVVCCCFIFTPHIHWIIALSLVLMCDKSLVDMCHVSPPYRSTLLTQTLNIFPWFKSDTPVGKSLWKTFQADWIWIVINA